MIEAVVTYYLGFSAKLISFLLEILIGYVAKNRSKSLPFLCHTDVTLTTTMKNTSRNH